MFIFLLIKGAKHNFFVAFSI